MTETPRTYRSPIDTSSEALHAWHAQPGALQRLTPPWKAVRILDEGGIAAGETARLRVPVAGPLGFDWRLVHQRLEHGDGFADVQLSGPFRAWRHEHRFEPRGEEASVLVDHLSYELPLGAAGRLAAGPSIARNLDELFAFRHRRTRMDLARHAAAGSPPLHIAITGATGLVGRRLVPFLQGGGHTVSRIVRKPTGAPDEIAWDPARGQIDRDALEGVDAVIHLAGASIAGGLWTQRRKAAIRDSRVDGTALLARTLASLHTPPKVFVSTSAVGYYGSRRDTMLTEDASFGTGFLADVCREWEAAARPAADAGIRVVNPRFGVIMAGEGGMLPILRRVFGLGIGGPLGSGKQYFAWIGLDDLLGILLEAIVNPSLEGPVNAVAPQETTNAEFTRALGKVLQRPTLFKVPALPVRALAGDMANDLILTSQRVIPARLADHGFPFAFSTIEAAVRHELGRSTGHPEVEAGTTLERQVTPVVATRTAA